MTIQDLHSVTNPLLRRLAGMVRRFTVTATQGVWRLTGAVMIDGQRETVNAEPFTGIGFYSRPSANGKPEAIVVNVGGPKGPVVVAARDEQTRASVADINADETAVFNSAALVYVKADGTIEIRTKNGSAVALAKNSDLNSLREFCAAQLYGGTGSALGVGAPTTPYTGTTCIKGE